MTTDSYLVPSVPRDIAVEATGNGELTVSWSAPSNDAGVPTLGYDLEWREKVEEGQPESGWVGYTPDLGLTREAMIDGLADDTTYQFQVRAKNTNGEGAWSDIVEGTTVPAYVVEEVTQVDYYSISVVDPATGDVLGKVKISVPAGTTYVDIDATGNLDTMRLNIDSTERQLPAVLRGFGLVDDEQIDEIVKLAVDWLVDTSGGESVQYTLDTVDSKAVHVINYSDGKVRIFNMHVDKDYYDAYYPAYHTSNDNFENGTAGRHVTRPEDIGEDGYRRAVLTRVGFPANQVEWKLGF